MQMTQLHTAANGGQSGTFELTDEFAASCSSKAIGRVFAVNSHDVCCLATASFRLFLPPVRPTVRLWLCPREGFTGTVGYELAENPHTAPAFTSACGRASEVRRVPRLVKPTALRGKPDGESSDVNQTMGV